MAKTLTKEVRVSNRYLDKITSWEETKVAGYNVKVKQQLLEPWIDAIVLFVLMFTVLGYLWAFIATIFSKFDDTTQIIISSIMYFLVAVVFCIFMSNKRLNKFVHNNRGEVGHKGKPYFKKVIVMTILSLIFGVISNILVFSLIIKDFSSISMENFSDVQPIIFASIYPFLYYLLTFIGLGKIQSHQCPVCGRFECIKTEKVTYGKKVDGYEKVNTYETRQIGSNVTTITYGSGRTESYSQPIYGKVCTGSYTLEHGTKMQDYIHYCMYCSYCVEGTKEIDYTKRV